MSQRRGSLAGLGFSVAVACCATLTACTGPGEPPAGTLSSPSSSPTGTTTPTGLPATASPSATGTGGTAASSSVDPSAYQPATSTSPAKNVPKPVMPEAAKKKDLDGQKAFIQYWIATYNYMRESGDAAPFLAACEKTSKFCAGSVKNLDDFKREGIWRVGGTVAMSEIRPKADGSTATSPLLTAVSVEAPTEFYTTDGVAAQVKLMPAKRTYDTTIALVWTITRWSVFECGNDER